MPETDLLTADEAARSLRISRRTFDGHVARGDIAYIAVGLGLRRIRRRFASEDIDRFRDRQRRVEQMPDAGRGHLRAVRPGENATIDFAALLNERRALRRKVREAEDKGPARPRRPI